MVRGQYASVGGSGRTSSGRELPFGLTPAHLKLAGACFLLGCITYVGWSPKSTSSLSFLSPDEVDLLAKLDRNNLGEPEWKRRNYSNVNVFEEINIASSDGSISASFIPLGATLTSLLVEDRSGAFRDVVLGYDNKTLYATDPDFAYYGSVVGRYANRIRNATFNIPASDIPSQTDTSYHTTPNENGGRNTLHGGLVGWSRSGFQLLQKASDSVTFAIVDRNGTEGFTGTVIGKVRYTLMPGAKWVTEITGHAVTTTTPIMLSSHVYWNLNGYQDSDTALDHHLRIKSTRHIVIDGVNVPTGDLGTTALGSPLDFTAEKRLGADLASTEGLCGTGCTGYDNCFIYDEAEKDEVVMELSSPLSGIRLSVKTDQPAAQVYSCNGQGSTPRKAVHGGSDKLYEQYSCVVLEQQGYIDGINHPEWGQDQFYGPSRPRYNWYSEYAFSTVDNAEAQ